MKLNKIDKKGNRSLYGSFLLMTLLPLVLCGAVMMLVCSYSVRKSICDEAQQNLANVAGSVEAFYDAVYEGDFNIVKDGDDVIFRKGEHVISDLYGFIDDVKNKSDVEISVFFFNTRMLTTLKDEEGDRIEMTAANDILIDEVLSKGNNLFADNVRLNGRNYYAYYRPIMSEDNSTIVGMIGAAKSTEEIETQIRRSVYRNLAVMLVGILVTAFCIVRFASSIVLVIKQMMTFLRELSEDKLNSQLSENVSHREDELGEVGRLMIKVQLSLRKLIERDALTGLYNRRSGEKRLDDLENQGVTYSVAIADIDFFKKFNDNFGHECGDVVLREVAQLLNSQMSGKGFVCRWGGEEFLMVFDGGDLETSAVALLDTREALHAHKVVYQGEEHAVTMTFGVAQKIQGEPINQLIRRADDKLYEGKQNGRDCVYK